MSGKNKKRSRIDDDIDRRRSHGSRTAQQPTSRRHPEHLSAFAAIRARQNESASDMQLLESAEPTGRLGADDWTEDDEGGEDDAAGAVARPAARSSLELWKELLDACPDDRSFSAFDAGERVKMRNGQALCIAGQYYIRVLSGGVTLCCSSLVPGSPAQRVVAPSTEPLPVIRCVTREGSEVEISNVGEHEDFETLGGISPLFREIWTSWATKSSSRPKRTFRIV
jgi:hypothetical protein